MLAQEVVKEFAPRARFAVEDLGASPLAARFGIDKYPAVFVDDALVARPEDFYGWGSKENGKYMPWSETAKKRAFQTDLRRLIDLRLAGEKVASLPKGPTAGTPPRLAPIVVTSIDGRKVDLSRGDGKPRIVEIWATWCAPCLESMPWLNRLEGVSVVAIAVESKPDDVRAVVERLGLKMPVVIGSDGVREKLGAPPSVPTLILAAENGRVVRTFYGAPPGLHGEVEKAIASLAK